MSEHNLQMSSIQERLQLKRVPLDTWNIREQLCLASAVVRSGDQNWMSVSRALKTVGDPNRHADWYSQKSCAAQYGALLEHVDTPKRKKRNSEGAGETPQESILKRLTQDRMAEIQKTVAEINQQYHTLKAEIAEVRSPATREERLRALQAAAEATRLRAAEQARRAWQRRNRVDAPPAPGATAAPSSPLLTSLLKSSPVVTTPQHISHPANSVDCVSPSAGAPTLSQLLEKSANASANTSASTSPHEKQAAIEHIKSQLVQIEQQLRANPSTPPPVPTLVSAPAIEIDDIEIKAEDVYAFRDVDIEIPPVAAMHKQPARILDKAQPKDEPAELTTEPASDAHAHAHAATGVGVCAELATSEAVQAPPPEAPKPEIEPPPPEPETESVAFPEVKFPTPEIKVIQPEAQKIKEEQIEADTPPEETVAAAAPEPEVAEAPEPEPMPTEPDTTPAEAEPSAPELPPETPEREEEIAEPAQPAAQPPSPPPGSVDPPSEPGTEPDTAADGDHPTQGDVEAEGVEESTPLGEIKEEIPETAPGQLAQEEETLKEGQLAQEGLLEQEGQLAQEGQLVQTGQLAQEGQLGQEGQLAQEGQEVEDAHTETDDDTPMELVREEEKTKRDYSRKKKPDSRTCSGSESAAETSAPESPSVPDAERRRRAWKKSVMLVYSRLAAHKYASLFVRAITDSEAPGYSRAVKRPMDLGALKRNIDSGRLRSTGEFQRDVLLMLSNALMYNSSEHRVYQMAKEMFQEAVPQLGLLSADCALSAPPRRRRHPEPPPRPAKRRHDAASAERQ